MRLLPIGAILAWICCSRGAVAVTGHNGMVAAEHRLAAKAGVEILRRGGNAVDAAVATAFAVCVANPSSCGIGGGGFLVIYDAWQGVAHALDYRETAPAAAHRDMFVRDGRAVPGLSLRGGLAVAVPGEVAGLLEAHRRFGRLPRALVMEPAIALARDGFAVEAHLAETIAKNLDAIRRSPDLAALLLGADGAAPAAGDVLRQPDLASTLERIAREGRRGLYEGPVAEAIVASVRAAGGVMTGDDLRRYRPRWRRPVSGSFRGLRFHSMPPPSSGGGVLVEILKILERDDLPVLGHNSATYLHLLAEAMQFGFADRAAAYGDPDFVAVPLARLVSSPYARGLRRRIRAARTFPPDHYGKGAPVTDRGTSHLSVVDRDGNAVACTTTINTAFGSMVVAGGTGVILNNQMDDFSAQAGVPNVYGLVGNAANAVAAGKRPLSSMTPTIVTRGGEVVAVAGASGGPFIISSTLQVLLNSTVFGMDADTAVRVPRIHHQWLPPRLMMEPGIDAGVLRALRRLGHETGEVAGIGAVQLVRRVPGGGLEGAADPRKGGAAVGW